MKKRLICLLLLSIFGYSCEEKQKKPLEDSKLQSLVLDLHLIQGAITGKAKEEHDSLRDALEAELFRAYAIDSHTLFEVKQYLENNPNYSDTVHRKVFERIKELRNR